MDRLVSGWNNKIVRNTFHFDDIIHKKILDFNYFVSSLEEMENIKNNIHFRPQNRLINLNDVAFIGHLEKFSQDFQIILTKINIPLKEPKQKK